MTAITTRRYADPATAQRYPLAVSGPAEWQWRDGAWRVDLALPDLLPGTILVPSLALQHAGGADAGFGEGATVRHRWMLEAGGARWWLQEVPAARAADRPEGGGAAVSTHIDCYHIHRRLEAPTLRLSLTAPQVPDRYLICASSRALTLSSPPTPASSALLPDAPPPRSQMTAPPAIASRICSPTCVSMVLDLWQQPHDWMTLVAECHDPATGMYGVWPLAVQAAARRGCLGAVEVFADWQEPLQALAAGVPLVTSIRFSPGELPGAPLPETGGHLVVVYGAEPTGVRVCDPAADRAAGVRRCYQAAAFSGAWLRHRGAAYILPR